ncbi:MAG: hypothetical protein ABI873_14160 [Marmoricola sp.]
MSRRLTGRVAFALVGLLSLLVLFAPGSDVPSGLPVNDKVVHVSLFLALAVTGRSPGVRVTPLVLGLVVYAGVSEVLQAMLPIHRDGDILDVAADLVGVAVGLAVVTLVRHGRDQPKS